LACDSQLRGAPRRYSVCSGYDAHDRIGPSEAIVQAWLPLLAGLKAIEQVLIEKDLVPIVDQPVAHFANRAQITTRMAYEDAGHRTFSPEMYMPPKRSTQPESAG